TSLRRRTIDAMRQDGLIGDRATLVSFWHRREEYGYPTPFLGRDEVLGTILPALEERGIYSRGRFAAWTYAVSNQDHSFMHGVEVADRLLGSGDEPTLRTPHRVNGGAFRETAGQGTHGSRSSVPQAIANAETDPFVVIREGGGLHRPPRSSAKEPKP